MISVENVAVERGGVQVLSDVSFRVGDGEFVALVGPNGAGKTTLLQTINGVLSPDAGRVIVDGVDVQTASAREVSQRVATVPQDANVAFDFSVADVVEMGRTPYRARFGHTDYRTDRRHVERALERTRTARFADRSIGTVSGGERQRVLLARALAQDTPTLLLDEPTASLDINHQVRTLELVADLVADGKTALAAIHDLDLAARFCDRLVLLADGIVVDRGTAESVLSSEHLQTAFDTEASVSTNPATGSPSVTARSHSTTSDLRVHVVGSGPVGAKVLGRLHDEGVTLTAGPTPDGDLLVETSRALDVDVVTAPPFHVVDSSVMARAVELAGAADAVVLANPPFEANSQMLDQFRTTATIVLSIDHPDRDPDRAGGESGAPDTHSQERSLTVAPDDVVESVVAAVEGVELPADD